MDIPTRETLERLYTTEQKSLAEIGRLYGKHPNQIRRWLIRAAIPTRSISEATSIAQKGRPLSEAHKEALRKTLREKADPAKTPETFAKISAANKGRTPHNKGKSWTAEERVKHSSYRVTPEYRNRLSAAHTGEKHWNWKGGFEQRSPRGWQWKERRKECYERDGWTCQDCGVKCHNGVRIQAHHIIPRRLGGSDELENLVTLCAPCHIKRDRQIH